MQAWRLTLLVTALFTFGSSKTALADPAPGAFNVGTYAAHLASLTNTNPGPGSISYELRAAGTNRAKVCAVGLAEIAASALADSFPGLNLVHQRLTQEEIPNFRSPLERASTAEAIGRGVGGVLGTALATAAGGILSFTGLSDERRYLYNWGVFNDLFQTSISEYYGATKALRDYYYSEGGPCLQAHLREAMVLLESKKRSIGRQALNKQTLVDSLRADPAYNSNRVVRALVDAVAGAQIPSSPGRAAARILETEPVFRAAASSAAR